MKLWEIFKKLFFSSTRNDLETEKEHRQRWSSIRIVYFTTFLMSFTFSGVFVGLWPYLNRLDPTASKEFMSLVVAAYPLGELIFSPVLGWWINKRTSVRLPFLLTLSLFIIANGTYASLATFPAHHKYWMLLSRLAIGISAANVTISRSYLSAATCFLERTNASSMLTLMQLLGNISGPAFQTAVVPLGETGFAILGFALDMYTAIGWTIALLGIINFILFASFFVEYDIAAKEASLNQTNAPEITSTKPDYITFWTLIAAYFSLVTNLILTETLATSVAMDQFAWTKPKAVYIIGLLMTISVVVSLVTILVINPLCKLFPERKIMLWGGIFMLLFSRLLCLPWGNEPPLVYDVALNATDAVGCPSSQEWCYYTPAMTFTQLVVTFIISTVGFSIGVTLVQTIFSKVLGAKPQGVWMGLMIGSGGLSRFVGGVVLGYVYTEFGIMWLHGLIAAVMALLFVWLCFILNRLIPLEEREDCGKVVEITHF